MTPNLQALVAFAAAGMLASPFLVRYAARRAAAQPVTYDPEAESVVLAWGYARPSDAAEMHAAGVEGASFADPARAEAWDALCRSGAAGFSNETGAAARQGLSSDAVSALAAAEELCSTIEIGRAAGRVLDAAEDRTVFAGRLPVERTGSQPPLRRVHRSPGTARYLTAALVMAVYGVAAAGFSEGAASALLLLFVGAYGYVCSAIDHDTMLIDDPTVLFGSLAAWGGVAGAAAIGEITWSQAGFGLATVVAWGLVFELINAAYKLIRHQDGLGFGDTLIIIVCAGVPAALSGSWVVGAYAVFSAFLLAILWSLPAMIRGTRGRKDPFALGPFLAAGWVVTWAVVSWLGLA